MKSQASEWDFDQFNKTDKMITFKDIMTIEQQNTLTTIYKNDDDEAENLIESKRKHA